ncbi:MAG: ATP-dependent DNA helicase RecG [Anaerolineales bacterium]|nr:ATP-dependent DNA helicase RecG [Anaerolineales bacterium]
MNPALEMLSKFLRLEASRGYDNRAVLGGLERTLDTWLAEARAAGVPEELQDSVSQTLSAYPSQSPDERHQSLDALWTRIHAQGTLPAEGRSQPAPSLDPGASASLAAPPSQLVAMRSTPQPVDRSPAPAEERPRTNTSAPEAMPADADGPMPSEADSPDDLLDEEEDEQAHPAATAGASMEDHSPLEEAAFRAPLTTLPGIGPKSAHTLGTLGLHTLGDLLFYFPRRYDDYSALKTINRVWYGEEVTIIATVDEIRLRPIRGGRMKLVEAVVSDGSGALRVSWFNQPWIVQNLQPGKAVVLSGRVDQYLGKLVMNSPEWEPLERQQLHTNRIVPVYPLTAGVGGKWLRRVLHSVVTRLAPRLVDPLSGELRQQADLIELGQAVQQIHFPDDTRRLEQAQQRLAFDELFYLILGVLRQKRDWQALQTTPLTVDDEWMKTFLGSLPFAVTQAQQAAMQDVRDDMASGRPMNRLLQGDVGSGKTVVAALAIAIACRNGHQAAMMAPTSILAEQHYRTLLELLPAHGVPADSVRLLIGATPEADKRSIRQGLAEGQVRLTVGTHALLEEPVQFQRLGLAIIDEQHRFGVEQRSLLRAKGGTPNLLVMTATPIPRSLALTIYGDLDVSLIDELPPGRAPIETRLLLPIERSRAHRFILSQIEAGRQAFIIYPLVESSEKTEALAAVEEYDRLQSSVFPERRIGLLHGRMRPNEKEDVMQRFRNGELDILVSTSVVEVGIDVPNASVIMIEGANRFGLSQLHQFRGRVGRSEHQSYCLLLPDSEDPASNERLKALESTTDGFRLAELDLEQRGPGDFLGTRQSGFAELRLAKVTDLQLVEKARRLASRLFQDDPDLRQPEHTRLSAHLSRFWAGAQGEIS